jgi:hypothetical protein
MTKKITCYKVEWPKKMSKTLIFKVLFLLSPSIEKNYNHMQHSNNKLVENYYNKN